MSYSRTEEVCDSVNASLADIDAILEGTANNARSVVKAIRALTSVLGDIAISLARLESK